MLRVERFLGALPISVSVGVSGRELYGHLPDVPREPASNEKLLLSMVVLDRFGPDATISTGAESRPPGHGVIRGNLWLVGHGDPEVGLTTLERLARRIVAAGVRVVRGSIVGDTSIFTRERWAPGWHTIALQFISIPTALTFEANQGPGGFVFDPERRAAAALTGDLRALGVKVRHGPRVGRVPADVGTIAVVQSARLADILRRQNVSSLNLDAEVLGKLLGAAALGSPGTIAKGAAAIAAWARNHGVAIVAHDASGLSHLNRISTDGMLRLLGIADRSTWGEVLRSTLPGAGKGTLAGRLGGLRVHAKTGTLLGGVSALSGWVWLERPRRWAELSILSKGLTKLEAVGLEDAVARIVATGATPGQSSSSHHLRGEARRGAHGCSEIKTSQRGGRKPARVTVTSRRTAAFERWLLAPARAWRQ
jgi:D-alanyl-D-alanine carboxypeptidase/D-alanyl-D-alanine-endopeptidase (penicillin-binding protein 4)